MKIITLFILICLCSLVYLRIQCERNNEYYCEEDETCCRGIYGWNCIQVYKGSCCVDGLKACENGTFCDSKSNQCVKKIIVNKDDKVERVEKLDKVEYDI